MGTTIRTPSGVQTIPDTSSGPALSNTNPSPLGTASPGVDVEVSRADHVHEAPAGGVDTSLQAAPDTGWTAAGAGSASIASGVVTLSMGASETSARLHRAIPASPYTPALEVSARITRTSTPGSGVHRWGIALSSEAWDRGFSVLCESDNQVWAYVNTSGTNNWVSFAGFPGGATLNGGDLWVRMVITPSYVAWFVGSGATRPTTWTHLVTRSIASDIELLSQMRIVTLQAIGTRDASTGTATGTVSDIAWRSLLGAPT